MRNIVELIVLLRTRAELPAGLNLATDTFREGWNFVRPRGAGRLEKKIELRGWHFIRIADGSLRSGVGETSQQAIASALKLALLSVSEHFNGVEVGRIQLTKYPWFTLARVRVFPFRIQQGEVHPVPDDALPLPAPVRRRRLAASAPWLAPQTGCPMPLLREILIESRSPSARPQ
jgi:hypothetical protein